MAGTVEGILAPVRHPAHWRVSMPIVVGAAEYQHDIGVILHQAVSAAEAAVRGQVFPLCYLPGDAGAADAIADADGAGAPGQPLPIPVGRIADACPFGDAVAEEDHLFTLQFHTHESFLLKAGAADETALSLYL